MLYANSCAQASVALCSRPPARPHASHAKATAAALLFLGVLMFAAAQIRGPPYPPVPSVLHASPSAQGRVTADPSSRPLPHTAMRPGHAPRGPYARQRPPSCAMSSASPAVVSFVEAAAGPFLIDWAQGLAGVFGFTCGWGLAWAMGKWRSAATHRAPQRIAAMATSGAASGTSEGPEPNGPGADGSGPEAPPPRALAVGRRWASVVGSAAWLQLHTPEARGASAADEAAARRAARRMALRAEALQSGGTVSEQPRAPGPLPRTGLVVPGSVVVVGSAGAAGAKALQAALRWQGPGTAVYAGVRPGGTRPAGAAEEGVQALELDVTWEPRRIAAALAELPGPIAGLVFAAQSVRAPQIVDRDGVERVARACVAAGIPRLALVSACGVTVPRSPSFALNNALSGQMQAKADGEAALRAVAQEFPDVFGYTVIRVGTLTQEPGLGVGALEASQADVYEGRLSYADLGQALVAALAVPAARNTTLELHVAQRAGVSGPPYAVATGLPVLRPVPSAPLLRAATWPLLFAQLHADSV